MCKGRFRHFLAQSQKNTYPLALSRGRRQEAGGRRQEAEGGERKKEWGNESADAGTRGRGDGSNGNTTQNFVHPPTPHTPHPTPLAVRCYRATSLENTADTSRN
ncbi:MAG: hypothetical protein F6K41_44585 [Symploca sp. SIO3E6]|nr:hypothetical protein [Caldora sp. SIO3E6]